VGGRGFATGFEVVQRIPQVTKELLTAVVFGIARQTLRRARELVRLLLIAT
jgi:hypothetical protein